MPSGEFNSLIGALGAGHATLSKAGDVLDSSLGNHRQEESNNRVRAVRRRAGARSVEWRCRRGGMRLRVCWPAGDGHWGGGESGCWQGAAEAFVKEQKEERHLHAFWCEPVSVARAVAL